MRWSLQDTIGFVLAWACVTAPLAVLTWFGDNMSKDGPVGWPAYLLPAGVGLAVAGLSSVAAFMLARHVYDRESIPDRPRPPRLLLHGGCGLVASLLLLVSFCVWWGDWSFQFADRFRG